jgi:hypothetical protein
MKARLTRPALSAIHAGFRRSRDTGRGANRQGSRAIVVNAPGPLKKRK